MSAEIQLGWNNGKLQAGAAGAAAIVNKASAQMKGALASITNGIGTGAGIGIFNSITSAIKALPTEIASATVAFDSMRIGMTVIEGSAEGASKRIEELQELAKLPGLGFQQAVEGDIRLRSAGISASVSKKAIEEMGNALAAVGKGKADMDGIILALSQIASKGKVSAEEINQIAERVPQIRAILKSTFGTADTEAIQKMNIPVESFITLVVDGFSRTVPRAVIGMQGKIDNFSDALQSAMAASGGSILESLMGPLEAVTKQLEEGRGAAALFGESTVGFFEGMGEVGSRAVENLDGALASTYGTLYPYAAKIGEVAQAIEAALVPGVAKIIEEQKKLAVEERASAASLAALTEKTNQQAAADKALVKEKDDLNNALDLYIAKQEAANAKAETAAAATAKQTEELAKLQSQLNAARDASIEPKLIPLEKKGMLESKLPAIDEKIAYESAFGDEAAVVKLKIERLAIEKSIADIDRQISAESENVANKEKSIAEATAKRAESNQRGLDVLLKELDIIEATASGHDKKAAKLQRELDIQEKALQIVERTGLAYAQAGAIAMRMIDAKEKADNRDKDGGGGGGGRSKIHGYSREEQGGADEARARAEQRVNESRSKAEGAVNKYMGMGGMQRTEEARNRAASAVNNKMGIGGMSESRLNPSSAGIGAKTPATDAKAPDANGQAGQIVTQILPQILSILTGA